MEEFDFISKIKILMGTASPNEDIIQFWLDSTKEYILNYCNLETLPKELNHTLVEMTCLRIRYNQNGVGAGEKSVASVSDGSQSVSYSYVGQKSANSDDELLNGFKSQLNRFRRLKW